LNTTLRSRIHEAVMSRARDPQNTKSLRRRGAHGGLREIFVGERVARGDAKRIKSSDGSKGLRS